MIKHRILLLGIVVLLLGACTLPQENLPPEGKPGALYTEAAQKVSVLLADTGSGAPLASQDSANSVGEGTPVPNPGETLISPASTLQSTANGTQMPCDRVKFVKDVTIPDEMDLAPGEAFTKTWRLQNAGTCPWTIGYLLYFENGDIMGGPTSQGLTSQPVFSGETLDVSVDLVAPQDPGVYQGYWKIRNVKGEGFGVGEYSRAFWVKINVTEGAGLMFDLNARADEAVWGSGTTPVDYNDLGGRSLSFDDPGSQEEPYVALLDQQFLEGGEISGPVLATYPPRGQGNYIIGRFPDYKVGEGDLLLGRVGLTTSSNGVCGDGNVTYRINIISEGNPATRTTLWEWTEVCDAWMSPFEIDLGTYEGKTVQIFLIVIANTDSDQNLAVWDSLFIHR